MTQPVPILLVDDDEVDVEAVRRAARKAGIPNPLHTASDGVGALDILRDGTLSQPCIILLDINMPRMNGFQFLSEMRKQDAMGQNVVFMLTTSARNEDVKTAYGHHAAGYFLKENLDGFISLLQDYCRNSAFPNTQG